MTRVISSVSAAGTLFADRADDLRKRGFGGGAVGVPVGSHDALEDAPGGLDLDVRSSVDTAPRRCGCFSVSRSAPMRSTRPDAVMRV